MSPEEMRLLVVMLCELKGDQRTLAREIGVTDAAISAIINGKRLVGRRVAAKLGYTIRHSITYEMAGGERP